MAQTYTDPGYVEDFYFLGDAPENPSAIRCVLYEARLPVMQSETRRTQLE